MSESNVVAAHFSGRPGDRRDPVRRPLRDAVARWFELHPSALATLDHDTVTEMARRVADAPPPARPAGAGSRVLVIGGFRLDRARRTAHAHGRQIPLTPLEFDLLVLLLAGMHTVQTTSSLTRRLWGSDDERHRRSLFVYIRRLRAKLETAADVPFRITTVFGRGYRIDHGQR